MLREAAVRLQRYILGILVVIIRVILEFAQDRPFQLGDGAGEKDLLTVLLVHKTGCAVGAVRDNIEATLITGVLVAGKPEIAPFGEEAEHQKTEGCHSQTCGCEDCE